MPILVWIGSWVASKFGGFVAANLLRILLIVGAVVVVLVVLYSVRKGGEAAAQLKELERALQVVQERRNIERRTKEMPDAELDDWLRPPKQRRRSR